MKFQTRYIMLILAFVSSLHAEELKEGKFGSDGSPIDCTSSYYGNAANTTICEFAQKRDISLSTLTMSVLVLQVSITADLCGFELSDKFTASLEKTTKLYPRSYEIAADYVSYQKPADCSKEKIMMKGQLK